MTSRLRVAMVGYGFMGAAHSQAWRVAPRFFDLPVHPEMAVIVGRDAQRLEVAARRFGWQEAVTDWRSVVDRADIDVIDICSTGDTHAEIAVAALEAGKHVLCEKPLANTVDEAERMAAAAHRAAARGVFAMVGFSYRRVPAIALAARLVAEGKVGAIRQTRAVYLQDWLTDPDAPATWRSDKAQAGSGALGDIAAHIIDAVQFVTGQSVTEVAGTLRTFVTERPSAAEPATRLPVTVDDAVAFVATLSGGALATFEASRVAAGRKNALRFEISGDRGALAFDLESLNELQFFDGTASREEQGFIRILVTEPEHPYIGAWWPPGHLLGYEHTFSNQVRDFVTDISENRQPQPSFDEGLGVQRVLDAVERSGSARSGWTSVATG
jgi:predicted dehydrogenase